MTYGLGRASFFDAGRICRSACWVAFLALAGCMSANIEDAAPRAAPGPGVVAPQNTGNYPNLNIRPQQAAPQFTDADRDAKLAALAAEREAAVKNAGAAPKTAGLDDLARNHGQETLKAIGAKCDPAIDRDCK